MVARAKSYLSGRKSNSYQVVGMMFLTFGLLAIAFVLNKNAVQRPKVVEHQTVVAEFDTVELPVPVQPISVGRRLRDSKFKTVAFPKHQVPYGAVTDISQYVDAITLVPLPANLPLFKENLSLSGKIVNPVIDKIPPTMRAMTIKVDATSSVEGWAGSGSIVDVLLVEKNRTTVIAEKVRILSAERSVAPVEGQPAPSVPSTVTLLVSQEQCLAINTAIPLGRIAFALRSSSDDEGWSNTTFTADALQSGGVHQAQSSAISGYVKVKSNTTREAYALTDGKWVKTEVIPEGFFVASDENK